MLCRSNRSDVDNFMRCVIPPECLRFAGHVEKSLGLFIGYPRIEMRRLKQQHRRGKFPDIVNRIQWFNQA